MYPVFRKYPNNSSVFKIESDTLFIEIQKLGKIYTKHTIEAKIFPDRQRIQDMINMHNGHWVEASEIEFNLVENAIS
jgi:hypothetical protein